jgi:RecG-like helicase
MGKPNPIWRALKRWGANNAETEVDELPGNPDAAAIKEISAVADRQVVTVRGVVNALEMKPREGIPWLEAELSDGSGSITLIWMGRKEVPGVRTGRELKVQGRLASASGKRMLYNPRYELIAT